MSYSYDSQAWNEMQRDAAPDYHVFASSTQKAIKAHKCDTCSGTIQPGETYGLQVGTEDGTFFINRFHAKPCYNYEHGRKM